MTNEQRRSRYLRQVRYAQTEAGLLEYLLDRGAWLLHREATGQDGGDTERRETNLGELDLTFRHITGESVRARLAAEEQSARAGSGA